MFFLFFHLYILFSFTNIPHALFINVILCFVHFTSFFPFILPLYLLYSTFHHPTPSLPWTVSPSFIPFHFPFPSLPSFRPPIPLTLGPGCQIKTRLHPSGGNFWNHTSMLCQLSRDHTAWHDPARHEFWDAPSVGSHLQKQINYVNPQ